MRKNFFIVAYTFILFLFIFFSYAFVDPNLFYLRDLYTGFSTSYRSITTAIYIALLFLLFLFYFFFSRMAYKNKMSKHLVLLLVVVTGGMLFFSYPAMFSYDIFNYLTTAKVSFYYQENPYIIMPIEFIDEPYLSFTRAANKIALYGPAWVILSGIPYFLGFGNFVLTLFNFKLFILFFYLLTGLIIFRLTKKIFPLVLFLLNPLVIIETLVSAHNDIVMMFFALLSYFLLQKRRIFLATIVFFFSVLIKYATIVLFPLFIYSVLKTLQKEKINWDKIFSFSGWAMLGVFLLSPLREEIYSWYVIWFFSFAVLIQKKHMLFAVSLILTFSTLLRYVPVFYTGSYIGITPIVKEILTLLPLGVVIFALGLRKFIKKYGI